MVKNIILVDNKFYAPLNFLYGFINNLKIKILLLITTTKQSPLLTPIISQTEEVDQELLNTINNEENWKITTVVIDPGHVVKILD